MGKTKILGLDPASCIGWAELDVYDDGSVELIDFGEIVAQKNLNLPQKLNFYYLEVKRLIDRVQPDYCSIEDLILGQSGVKVLVYLGRISGVVIHSCFEVLKDRVELYYPNIWKANSLKNLAGNAPKWHIQFEVCREFSNNLNCDISSWKKVFDSYENSISNITNKNQNLKNRIDEIDKKLKRKRNPISDSDRKDFEEELKTLKKEYKANKEKLKKQKSEQSSEMEKLNKDIYSQTGISYDIADAICIALCLKNKLL